MDRFLLVLAALIAATLLWSVADQGGRDGTAIERTGALRREASSLNDLATPLTHTARAPASEMAAIAVDAVLPDLRAETTPNANGMLVVVEDASGAPLPGALVKVWWRKGWGNYDAEEGVTDAQGILHTTVERLVEFEDIDVRTEEGGDVFTSSHGDITCDPRQPDRVRVRVPATQRLNVHVEDLGGRPQRGVDIEYHHTAPLESDPFLNVLARENLPAGGLTDDDGRCSREAELGTWSIRVIRAGTIPLGDLAVTLDDAGGEKEVTLRVLSTEDCRPVRVTVRRSGSSMRLRVWARGTLAGSFVGERLRISARKREDDSYEVLLPRLGSWTIFAACTDHRRGEAPLSNAADAVTIVLERLPEQPPPRRLGIRVIAADNGAPLRATLSTTTDMSTNQSRSGPRAAIDGFLELEYSHRRPFYVRAEHRGYVDTFLGPFESKGARDSNREGPFEITMLPALSIAGHVIDTSGDPVECWVYLHRSSDSVISLDGPSAPAPKPTPSTRVGTGELGQFYLREVTAGVQRLWVVPEDASLPPALVDARGGDEAIVVTIGDGLEGRGALGGRVVDALSGHAAADIEVELRATDDRHGAGTMGLSIANGSYAVFGVVPGRFDVVVRPRPESRQHFAQRVIEDVEILPGENTLDIALLPARQLHVVVLDQGGEPLGGAWIGAVDGEGLPVEFLDRSGSPDGSSVWTDAAGRASMNGLPAGWVTLRVWRGEESMDAGDAPIGQVEVDLALPVAQRVKVACVTCGTEPGQKQHDRPKPPPAAAAAGGG